MATPRIRTGGRKTRKYGRNKAACEYYKNTHQRENNKLNKMEKRLKSHPNDKGAQEVVKKLKKVLE